MADLHREYSDPIYNYDTKEWEVSFRYVDENGNAYGNEMFFSHPNKTALPKVDNFGWTYGATATFSAVTGLKIGLKIAGTNPEAKLVFGGIGAVAGAIYGASNEVFHVFIRDISHIFEIEFNPQYGPDSSLNTESIDNAFTSSIKSSFDSLISDVKTIAQFAEDTFDGLASGEATGAPPRRFDPLTLDLDGDGVELVNVLESKAFFDLDLEELEDGESAQDGQVVYTMTNADGSKTKYVGDGLKEQAGWVKADDGLLTLDRNGNGTIDNILELFGKQNKTGTEELREYDSNDDGVINSSDSVFSKLKLWQDFNQDGVSDEGELHSLSDLNIKQINLDNVSSVNQVQDGNLVISKGSYVQTVTDSEGNSSDETKTYANLDLAVNQSNSASYSYTDDEGNEVGDYDLNLEVLSLPMSRGYGNVKALPIAASENEDLLKALQSLNDIEIKDYKNITAKIEDIIYKWTGVEDVTGNRGNFDAKKLKAMEELRGEEYTTAQDSHDVTTWQVAAVNGAWNSLVDGMKVKLLTQSLFKDIFAKTVTTTVTNDDDTTSTTTSISYPSYDFENDAIDFNEITPTEIFANFKAKFDALTVNISTATDSELKAKINNAYSIVEKTYLTKQVAELLNNIAQTEQIDGLTTEVVKSKIKEITDSSIGGVVIGTENSDDLGGTIYDDYNSETGSYDTIHTATTIIGSKGDDYLSGHSDDDIYIFNKGDGHDTIDESGRRGYFNSDENRNVDNGTDTILFGSEISKNDIYITGTRYEPVIKFKNSPDDSITIKYQSLTANQVEKLLFADGSEIDLTDPNLEFSFIGSDESDIILGSTGDDIIESGKGLDFLHGRDGDDKYVFNKADGIKVISEYGGLRDYVDQFRTGTIKNTNYYSNGTSTSGKEIGLGTDTIEINGYRESEIVFAHYQNNLIIQFKNSPNDRIVIKDQMWHSSYPANLIENLKLIYEKLDENGDVVTDTNGDAVLETKTIDLKNKDWSDYTFELQGTEGDDSITSLNYDQSYLVKAGKGDDTIHAQITGTVKDVVNEVYGEDGDDEIILTHSNDIISGGKGDDILKGGKGNDVYLYNIGDGKDEIEDTGITVDKNESGGSADKISFGLGISKDDLIITRSQNYQTIDDLIISFKDSSDDQITIKNFFDRDYNRIELLEFSTEEDGEIVKTSSNLKDFINLKYEGTDNSETISGSNYASEFNDIIDAKGGNDYVNALNGNDQITGGKGNDNLSGYNGDDTYIFNLGDGKDVVNEVGYWGSQAGQYSNHRNSDFGDDKIKFGEGISKENLKLSKSGNDLFISFKNSADDLITVSNFFYGTANYIETLEFSDGSTIDLTDLESSGVVFEFEGTDDDDNIAQYNSTEYDDSFDLKDGDDYVKALNGNDVIHAGAGNDNIDAGSGNDKIYGGAGDDNISAGDGNDIIEGGKGDDYIGKVFTHYSNGYPRYTESSNPGDDTYIYNKGDGKDYIIENNSYSTSSYGDDKIVFGEGISKDDLIFYGGSDLKIGFKNSADDQITIRGFFNLGNSAKIETLEFADGSSIDLINDKYTLTYQGTDENDSIIASSESDIINGLEGSDTIIALEGDDIITGGKGNDTVGGNYDVNIGDDTYIYNKGDGVDKIIEYKYRSGTNRNQDLGNDKIQFGEGITKNDIYFDKSSYDLYIRFKGNDNDSIRIVEHFRQSASVLETLEFADGSTFDLSSMNYYASNNDDVIVGNNSDETISSLDGDDYINGKGGNDILSGGEGDDSYIFAGSFGNDLIIDNDGKIIIDGVELSGFATREKGIENSYNLNGYNLSLVANQNSAYDLVISNPNNSSNSITIQNFNNQTFGIELEAPNENEVYGTDSADKIVGEKGAEEIFAGSGDDIIYGDGEVIVLKDKVNSSISSTIELSSQNITPSEMADVNGDGKSDIVSFAKDGVYISISNGDGTFGDVAKVSDYYSETNGWVDNNVQLRKMGDINGDGKSDIIGFGNNKIMISFANDEGGFDEEINSGLQNFTRDVGGWKGDDYLTRFVEDVNGDGKDDIVGFGYYGVFTSLSNGDGTFRDPITASTDYTYVKGWNEYHQVRRMGDINGDGRADIIGFGYYGVQVSFGKEDGTFSELHETGLENFGYVNGRWLLQSRHTREVADINGDGFDDIIGFGDNKTFVSYSNGEGGFSSLITYNYDYTVAKGYYDNNIKTKKVTDIDGDGVSDVMTVTGNNLEVAFNEYYSPNNSDVIRGEGGNDEIHGGLGNDSIVGGLGADKLYGDKGSDIFVFESLNDSTNQESDLILDFIKGEDKIDLSNISEISSIEELSFRFENNQTIIDHNDSDFLIKLSEQIQLDQQDFIMNL